MSADSARDRAPAELTAFLITVGNSPPTSEINDKPPWFEPGATYEVNDRIYAYFLRVAPPGSTHPKWFTVGQGVGPYRLFWQTENRCFARELSDVEARRFAELTGITLITWRYSQWATLSETRQNPEVN